MHINYISELTGSGKTGEILERISKSSERYVIAVPNKTLCVEIAQRLFQLGVTTGISIISSDQHKMPSAVLAKSLSAHKDKIIVTTHASFTTAMSDNDTMPVDGWNLVIDEELSIYSTHEINVSDLSKKIIDKTIDFEEYDESFYKVSPKNRKLWVDIVNGECNDTFLNTPAYVRLVKHCLTDSYLTLIDKKTVSAYKSDKADFKKNKVKKFYAISLCNEYFFRKFSSVLIMSSFFEDTINYKLMKWMGFDLNKLDMGFSKVHPNSKHINIKYYCSSNWSTVLKNKSVDNQNTTLDESIRREILSEIKDQPFIYNSNLNTRHMFGNGVLVSATHGVNQYIDYTTMVYMPSLNATVSLVNTLKSFNITRSEIDFSRNVLTAYQFVSRGALRKAVNNETINIYVMDRRTVNFLQNIFPEATIEYVPMEKNIIKKSKNKKTIIPNKVSSFISRVNKRLEKGEGIRKSTLTKYKMLVKQYYK